MLVFIYIWTDFPFRYIQFGMLPYFLGIPLALCAMCAFARFVDRGRAFGWMMATVLLSASFLVHLTTAMVTAPACAAAYLAATVRSRQSVSTNARKLSGLAHLGVWLIPPIVLAVNAFWWLPGIWLADTLGSSDFAFSHPEGVLLRLFQTVKIDSPIECMLIAFGLPGIYLLVRRVPVLGWSALGFCAAGFSWGYLASTTRSLDFFQPGRHT